MAITYRGERFSGYNKPKRTPGKSKKFAVLAKQGDKTRLIRFGDPNMTIKKDRTGVFVTIIAVNILNTYLSDIFGVLHNLPFKLKVVRK